MKISLVHDYLREYGGAEKVLEALNEVWHSADIYTSVYEEKKMEKFGFTFTKSLINKSSISRELLKRVVSANILKHVTYKNANFSLRRHHKLI